MYRLRLPQEALLDRHDPQLPTHDRLASRHARTRRLAPLALRLVLADVDPKLVVDNVRVAHIAVVLRLHAYRIVLELAEGAYSRVEVDGVVLQVLRGLVACERRSADPHRARSAAPRTFPIPRRDVP